MIQKTIRRSAVIAICGFLAWQGLAKADSITNNFDESLDYMANGVSNSMWDGIYLGYGYVYDGQNGDGNNGYTLQANETANPGYLTIQTSGTDWSGTGDDGFFLYKVVAGDFDVSVENVAPFDNTAYHFGGLMVRAFNAGGPHWSAPYGGSENWVDMMRFQEFGIDEDIRYALNGADNDGYITVSGASTDTTTDRYLRITRVGDVFSFYTKTNQTDTWALHGSLTRADLHGLPLQVGIADATFSTAMPLSYYTDFELTGTNVMATPVLPVNPTGLVAKANNANVTFSWTPGTGSLGSVLVLRQNNTNVLSDKPINTYTYNASTNFASGDDLAGGIYVVYSGSASSVTVAGLGSTNQQYSCAVYSYTNSGSAILYGLNPSTTNISGTGIPGGINFSITPSSGLPLNGVAVPILRIFDSIGDTDILANASATWSSSDSTVLTVAADGTISAVGLGTAQVIATYANFSVTNSLTVHAPAFADSFGVSHSYLTNGLAGSGWNGLYLSGTDVPNASYGPPPATVSVFDANISSNNTLSITAANSGWQGAQDNGPFLFKNVAGDFEASVHITSYSILNYEFIGLQARAYSTADNASPSGTGYSENFVDWLRFDEYGISTSTFNTTDGNNVETDETDGDSSNYWLLMVRADSTNFYFFKKINATDPWSYQPSENITRPDLTNGVPLQVGLVQSMFTATAGSVLYDSFALDAVGLSNGVPPSAIPLVSTSWDPTYSQATFTWTPATNSDGSTASSLVVVRGGSPVNAQPFYGEAITASSVFGQGTDLGGGNYVVYSGTGNTVTVTGLIPGDVYYAAVYGYSGSGTNSSYNLAGGRSTVTPPVVLTGITASLAGSIPVNGVGLPTVTGHIQGGGTFDITKSVQIVSGNTNVAVATNYVISGLATGIETNTVTFVFGDNTFTASLVTTVRAAGYTDNFGTAHDYILNGVTNTAWDGVYNQPGDIPATTYTSDPLASITDADADVTSNNVLNVTSENVGWEGAQNDGFFLFKNVTGDFQTSVHISYLDSAYSYDGGSMVAYNNPGLLARAYNTNGSPYNINSLNRGETWVSFSRFDLYGIGTYARYNLNNNVTRSTETGGFNGANTTSDTNLWLLMVRQSSTNFLFFQRQFATDPWVPTPNGITFGLTNFTGLPLQVGLLAGGFESGNQVTVGFDSFMLDQSTAGPTLTVSLSGTSIVVKWPVGLTYTLQTVASLGSASWQTVTNVPVVIGGYNTVTLPATNAAAFYRLTQ